MLRTLCSRAVNALTSYNPIEVCVKRYAGHSKWQNIRHIKGAKDAERATIFLKLSRQIKIAVQEGGSTDPKLNLRLENMIEQARRVNMPQATIQNVLKSCENDKSNVKGHTFEIKGPGGSFILLEVLTSNLHHLKQTLATVLRKNGAKYGDGGGLHLFYEKGIILAENTKNSGATQEQLLELATEHAIESGAEDVTLLDEPSNCLEFLCASTCLRSVTKNLEERGYRIHSASNEFLAHKLVSLNEDEAKTVERLYEKLEALPETVRITDNIG